MEEFELLNAQISSRLDDHYMGLLLGILKEEVQVEVMELEPANCYKMFFTARMIERKLVRNVAPKSSPTWQRHDNFQGIFSSSSPMARGMSNSGVPTFGADQNFQLKQGGTKRMNKSENGLEGSNREILSGTCNLPYQERIEKKNQGL